MAPRSLPARLTPRPPQTLLSQRFTMDRGQGLMVKLSGDKGTRAAWQWEAVVQAVKQGALQFSQVGELSLPLNGLRAGYLPRVASRPSYGVYR